MGLIHWAKEKIEMKVIASLIERVFKNWITTVLGILLGFAGVVSSVYNLIPTTLVWHGYNVANTLLAGAGVAVALAGIIAKDQNIGINPPTLPTKLGIFLIALLVVPVVHAQTTSDPENIYAAGASYGVNASPSVAGTFLYAHSVTDRGTYAFTVLDALPTTSKPYTVTTNVGVDIAQKVATISKIPIYMPNAVGISWTGSNTGWQWSGGGLASIHLKGSYYLMPSVRFLKSSVNGGTGYQPILGLLVAWGE